MAALPMAALRRLFPVTLVLSGGVLLGTIAVRAHHVPGDDHTGTMISAGDPPAAKPSTTPKQPLKALYNTKAEAEAAAPLFNCKGAHAMGSKWMPCSAHNHGGAAHSAH
ncbi:DUF3721 domain-containing protein [Synechococcus sp. BS55D]|uniref:DUF3721 domain-containing protein n=1 Tax=Synechococcus sp. BS55D TaxID=2055943 RepID=UPI001F1E4101|nr:DUF3721 domain-containing protein [Synechococcus sp. BS55D]